jgi:hypothetical protein
MNNLTQPEEKDKLQNIITHVKKNIKFLEKDTKCYKNIKNTCDKLPDLEKQIKFLKGEIELILTLNYNNLFDCQNIPKEITNEKQSKSTSSKTNNHQISTAITRDIFDSIF